MKPLRILTITVVLFIVFSLGLVHAQEISRDLLKFDNNILDDSKNSVFSQPKSILVVPIESPTSNFAANSSEWFSGIYYYMTARLGLGDILFHYGVSQDGLIFQGINNGDEQSIAISEGPENPIVIAYLAEKGATDFDKSSIENLTDFLLSLCNKHAIDPSQIYVNGINFEASSDAFKLISKAPGGRYRLTLNEIKKEIKPNYKPQTRKFSVEVGNLQLPGEPVSPGDEVTISFTVKNTSQYTIYKGTDQEFILSKTGVPPSKFYNTNSWLTTTDIELMSDGQFIRPGEEAEVSVKLIIPLYFGKQTETFVLKNLNGNVYSGSEIPVSVEVNRIDAKVIEVLATETGTLNVRNAAGGNEIIENILPGERYIELSRDGGWVQIQLNDGTTGWVSNRYVKNV